MTATDVRDRARSLADLPNAQIITPDDEINSLNETYHDVYDWILQNDDDYFVTETTIVLTASMQSATNLANNEYVVPLPTDFYKLRYLDYRANNQWQEVDKMPLSARDVSPASPQYRIRGAYLWLIGGMNVSSGYTIRLGYYPTPKGITLPFPTLSFGTSYSPASFQNITEVFFTNSSQSMIYNYGSTSIYVESIASTTVGTPFLLYTSGATVSQMQYYKGYLYLNYSMNIYRAATSLVATIAAFSTLTTSNDVTDYAIFRDTIYLCTATAVKTANLTGTVTAVLGSLLNGPIRPALIGSSVYYVDSTNNLMLVGATATLISNVSVITTEGTYLYIQDTSNNLYQATVTSTTLGSLATIASDCLSVHIPELMITTPQSDLDQVYLPVITRESPQMLAIGSSAPYEFSYPSVSFTDVMAYQMAIDFKSKAGQDPSMLAGRLGSRDVANGCTGLWLRLYQSLRRDDYQPSRINHRYQQPWGIW